MRAIGTVSVVFLVALTTSAAAQSALRELVRRAPVQNVISACAPSADEVPSGLHVEVRLSGQLGPGQNVQVSSMNGAPVAAINCDGPWAVFTLPPGRYKVMAFLGPLRSSENEVNITASGLSVTLVLDPAPNSQVAETLGVPRTEVAEDVITSLPPPPPELFLAGP